MVTTENNQHESASSDQILQFMIAEHSSLASTRGATIFESAGRTNIFLTTVSSALLALTFIVVLAAHISFQVRRWRAMENAIQPLFPSGEWHSTAFSNHE